MKKAFNPVNSMVIGRANTSEDQLLFRCSKESKEIPLIMLKLLQGNAQLFYQFIDISVRNALKKKYMEMQLACKCILSRKA